MIKVRDRVPADCIVLHTYKDSSELFIKTDQLDGETDWKQKRALSKVFDILKTTEGSLKFLENGFRRLSFEIEPPSKNIYKFSGRLDIQNENPLEMGQSQGIDVDNCIWANTKVTSGMVMAVVI